MPDSRSIKLPSGHEELHELDKRKLPHHRGFTFHWSDGATWKLRLDQGFGFLAEQGRSSTRFRFNASTEIQAKELLGARISLDRRDQVPSVLYLAHVPRA